MMTASSTAHESMKTIHFHRRRHALFSFLFSVGFIACCASETTLSAAQIERSVFSGGGATATSSAYSLTDTAGQTCVGTSSSANYSIADGFWPDYGAAPLAASLTLGARYGQTTDLSAAKLLLLCSDPNAETLSVVAVSATSTNGGAVALAGNIIEYTPANGISTTDAFTYLIADTGGDTAAGTITVNLPATNSGGSYNYLTTDVIGSDVRLTFLGVPNLNYALDRTYNLTSPVDWVPQFTNSAATNGVLIFTNTPLPGTNNFWRTRYVP
jgi:hypothetical protein